MIVGILKSVSQVKLVRKKSSYNFKTFISISVTIAALIMTGCSSNKAPQDDNTVKLTRGKQIILKSGRVIQQGEYTSYASANSDDLWQRVRDGFQLQDEYITKTNYQIQQQKTSLTSNTKSTEQLLSKGSPYLHYIVEQLEGRNMPLELALLPAVESGYNPSAHSRMRAAGLWQFMPQTGTQFNLQQTRWYDARLDVIASTNAALDYLQYLHNMFNDWPLALAAYNSGEGTVKRAIQRNQAENRPTDYWHLPLPTETKNYVPKLLALSRIVFSPQQYQVNIPEVPNQPYFAQVEVNNQIKLNTLASLLAINSEDLKSLNAGLKAEAVINNQSPKKLLIPTTKVFAFNDLMASGQLRNETVPTWNNYYVRSGDTLNSVASRHKMTISELKTINKLAGNQLKVGQQLQVPIVASSINDTPANKNLRTIVLRDKQKYTIQPGDNLWSISQKNNIKLEKLLKINRLSANASIKPGQQLYITERY